MTSSGVLMKNTLVSHRVDHRLSCDVESLSSSFVAGENSLANVLDSCAIARTLCREVLVASNCLDSALASLLRICHCFFPCLCEWRVFLLYRSPLAILRARPVWLNK